jgi:hypothetical protein
VEIVMGALATLDVGNDKVSDGYPLYSDLFGSVEQLNEERGLSIELNPYVIGTAHGTDPTESLRAIIEASKEADAS